MRLHERAGTFFFDEACLFFVSHADSQTPPKDYGVLTLIRCGEYRQTKTRIALPCFGNALFRSLRERFLLDSILNFPDKSYTTECPPWVKFMLCRDIPVISFLAGCPENERLLSKYCPVPYYFSVLPTRSQVNPLFSRVRPAEPKGLFPSSKPGIPIFRQLPAQ